MYMNSLANTQMQTHTHTHTHTHNCTYLEVIHIRCDNFAISPLEILATDEINELVVDTGTMWKPESASRAQFVEHKKVLLRANDAVVALLGLLDTACECLYVCVSAYSR
jgi:hypothetical protein